MDQRDIVVSEDIENHGLRLLVMCVGAFLLLAAGAFHFLSRDIAMFIVSWVGLSISVGIWFGHFVLNEP